MILSQRCEYAIRTALYLAAEDRGGYVSVREISGDLHIPYAFLAKVVQKLTAAHLFDSMRGPTGGIALAHKGMRVTLEDIVLAIDGPSAFACCILGLPGCGEEKPCPLHDQWAPARQHIHNMFSTATLADTAVRVNTGELRLASLLPAA